MLSDFVFFPEMLYFAPKDARNKFMISLGVISSFMLLVLGVIGAIYILRFSLQPFIGIYVSFITSALSVLQITGFNLLYQSIAVKLNNQENHRTDSEYEDNLIVKVFCFQFINSYASCFYIAFIAMNIPLQPGSPEGEWLLLVVCCFVIDFKWVVKQNLCFNFVCVLSYFISM